MVDQSLTVPHSCWCSAEELGLKSFHLLTNTSKHRAMLQGMQVMQQSAAAAAAAGIDMLGTF
jgi:hypothetical protein